MINSWFGPQLSLHPLQEMRASLCYQGGSLSHFHSYLLKSVALVFVFVVEGSGHNCFF